MVQKQIIQILVIIKDMLHTSNDRNSPVFGLYPGYRTSLTAGIGPLT
jgi:hypothetical protein